MGNRHKDIIKTVNKLMVTVKYRTKFIWYTTDPWYTKIQCQTLRFTHVINTKTMCWIELN